MPVSRSRIGGGLFQHLETPRDTFPHRLLAQTVVGRDPLHRLLQEEPGRDDPVVERRELSK